MKNSTAFIRKYDESDGRCCASLAGDTGCLILSASQPGCGTYACPFYKPEGCADWVRRDLEKGVSLVPPDEYY